MAIELFKPFVMKRLGRPEPAAQNVPSTKRMVERARPVVWDVLEEVGCRAPGAPEPGTDAAPAGHPGIRATADRGQGHADPPAGLHGVRRQTSTATQMAVHVPLSAEAQAEARVLMPRATIILKPAVGRPVTMPTQDMVLGIYFLTSMRDGGEARGSAFSSPAEAIRAFNARELSMQAAVTLRQTGMVQRPGWQGAGGGAGSAGHPRHHTRPGAVQRGASRGLRVRQRGGRQEASGRDCQRPRRAFAHKIQVAATLDALKEAGFCWATRSGVTVSVEDIATPAEKQQILEELEAKAEKVERSFKTRSSRCERREELIDIWTDATNKSTTQFARLSVATTPST